MIQSKFISNFKRKLKKITNQIFQFLIYFRKILLKRRIEIMNQHGIREGLSTLAFEIKSIERKFLYTKIRIFYNQTILMSKQFL